MFPLLPSLPLLPPLFPPFVGLGKIAVLVKASGKRLVLEVTPVGIPANVLVVGVASALSVVDMKIGVGYLKTLRALRLNKWREPDWSWWDARGWPNTASFAVTE